jgi:hypothetical protein
MITFLIAASDVWSLKKRVCIGNAAPTLLPAVIDLYSVTLLFVVAPDKKFRMAANICAAK